MRLGTSVGFGLLVSVLLHAGLLAWALLNFHATPPLKLPDEIPVEVSIISQIDLETRQKKGDSLSKIEEAAMSAGKAPSPKDAPKPMPVRAVEPPPPAAAEPSPPEPPKPPEPVKEEAPPPPKPDQIAALIEKTPTPAPPPEPDGPTLDDKKKLEEKLAEQQRQEEEARKKAEAEAKKKADDLAKKKADDKKKADKKLADDKKKKDDAKKAAEARNKFDPSKIAQDIASAPDLLNKVKDQPSAAQGAETAPSKPTTAKGPTAGTKTGTDNVNKARAEQMIVAMLNSAFEQCWNKPLAGGGVAAPVVTLKWNLNQDGSLQGEPKVVQTDKGNPLSDQAERAALRAVQTCVPFQLPPDLYNMWREVTWKFNPNQTL